MKVLITSGGTKIKFDDVRFLEWDFWADGATSVFTNFSKGGFGSRIAYSLLNSHEPEKIQIHHLHGSDAANQNDFGWDKNSYFSYPFFDYHEYAEKLENLLKNTQPDIVFLSAAVADYGLPQIEGKVSSDQDEITIKLKKLPKVISKVKEWHPNCIQVGFKLLSNVTTETLIDTAFKAGDKSGSDFTVANDLATLKSGKHSVYLVDHHNRNVDMYPVWCKVMITQFLTALIRKAKKYKTDIE